MPLDALTDAEAQRTRALLAAQARAPGRAAPVLSRQLLLGAAPSQFCRLS